MMVDECHNGKSQPFAHIQHSSFSIHHFLHLMPRISRIAGSFAIVVIAYWAYALLVVRWIEPPADLAASQTITETDRTEPADWPICN